MAGETILVGEVAHETNTFSSIPTDRATFQEQYEYFEREVTGRLRGTNTMIGGTLDVGQEEGVEFIPTVAASGSASGLVTSEAYEFYTEYILERAKANVDILDGVLLPFHGSMVPEGKVDGEGPLIEAVRKVVGQTVPIVVTVDLHANVTEKILTQADALVAYETYPHTDMGGTGRTGMNILLRTIRGEIDPVMHVERPPILTYGPKEDTNDGPMAKIMSRARDLEEERGILKVNVLPGFQEADVPAMGFSLVVVSDGEKETARTTARDLAETVWERRERFLAQYPGPQEAVSDAKRISIDDEQADGPVVLADVGDNPGGGGSTDGTEILRACLDQGLTNVGIAIIRDPDVVEECVRAGVGNRTRVTLGGKTDDLHGVPIKDIKGYVKAVTDGTYINRGEMATGTETKLGRTVLFKCGEEESTDVIVTENRVQPYDLEVWRHVGIVPEHKDVLVVKSKNHYRANYGPIASEVIPVDSTGVTAMDPRKYEFSRIERPKFPLDEMESNDYPDWNGS